MALQHERSVTVEEYLEIEENDPDTRYEYLDGELFAMAGGSLNHAAITGNIYAILIE